MEQLPIVKVEWLDASSYNEPHTAEWLKRESRPLLVITIGFLISSENNTVIIGQELIPKDGVYRDTMVIPKRYIRKIIYLEEKVNRVEEVKEKEGN